MKTKIVIKGIVSFSLLLLVFSLLFINRHNSESQSLKPTENGSDEEGHRGRDEYFNLIHTGDKNDDSWKEEVATVRHNRALQNMGTARSRSSYTSFGSLIGKWTERGAANQAGRVLTTDVLESRNKLIMGTQGGTILLGSVTGGDFTVLNDQIKLVTVAVHIFENGSAERIVAVTNKGVYSTDNYGATWELILEGNFTTSTYSRSSNKLYIKALNGKLYESSDSATIFTLIGTVEPSYRARMWTARYADSPLFILTTSGKVYKYTTDSLSVVGTIFTQETAGDLSLSGLDDWSSSTLYAAIDEGDVELYRSTNGGSSWTWRGTTPLSSMFHLNRRSFYSADANTIYIGDMECERSSDGGSTWNSVNAWYEYNYDPLNMLHADITEIRSYQDQSGNDFTLISTDGGIYKTTDNSNYKNITMTGTPNSQYYGSGTRWDTPDIIIAGSQDQGIQHSQTGQTEDIYSFTQYSSGDYGSVVSSDSGKTMWYTYIYGAMYYVPDTRVAEDIGAGRTGEEYDHLWMAPTIALPDETAIAYVGGHFIERFQNNGGNDWTITEYSSFDFASSLTAIAYSPSNLNRWYAATASGKLYYSSDRGITWSLKNSSFLGADGNIGQQILPDPNVDGKIYICGNGTPAVEVSTDYGATFSSFGTYAPGGSAIVNRMDLSDDGKYLFAASDLGAYVYTFSENRWYNISTGVAPDQIYRHVEYVPTINTARFSTYGRGIWDFTISDATTPTYSLAVNSGSGDGDYEAGEIIPISADSASSGKVFDSWVGDVSSVADITSGTTTVTIPSNSISISATYIDDVVSTLSLSHKVTKPNITIRNGTVLFQTPVSGKFEVSLFSLNGRLLYSNQHQFSEGNNNITFNNAISTGVYAVIIKGEGVALKSVVTLNN